MRKYEAMRLRIGMRNSLDAVVSKSLTISVLHRLIHRSGHLQMRIDTGAKPLERPGLEAKHAQAFGILDLRATRLRAIS